jgi:hypothetical protein
MMVASVPVSATVEPESEIESMLPQIGTLGDKFTGGEIVMDATFVEYYCSVAD